MSTDPSTERASRLFGSLIAAPLKERQRDVSADANKKRAEIEERLRREREENIRQLEEMKQKRESERKQQQKDEDLAMKDAQHELRFAAQLSIANMLCTSPDRPVALGPGSSRPIYYLPAVLLPTQQDTIDKQIADTRRAVAEQRRVYEDSRAADASSHV